MKIAPEAFTIMRELPGLDASRQETLDIARRIFLFEESDFTRAVSLLKESRKLEDAERREEYLTAFRAGDMEPLKHRGYYADPLSFFDEIVDDLTYRSPKKNSHIHRVNEVFPELPGLREVKRLLRLYRQLDLVQKQLAILQSDADALFCGQTNFGDIPILEIAGLYKEIRDQREEAEDGLLCEEMICLEPLHAYSWVFRTW